MEAIVPAFVLAALCQIVDRPALLAAVLADRYGRPLLVAFGAGLAHAAGNGIAALGGAAMAPLLTPEAQALLLAVALVLGGAGGLLPSKLASDAARLPFGALLTPAVGVFVLAAGERTQFFTLAVAAHGMPELAAAGATLAAFAVALVAASLGEPAWRKLPLQPLRIGTGLLFMAIGVYFGLGAFRLR